MDTETELDFADGSAHFGIPTTTAAARARRDAKFRRQQISDRKLNISIHLQIAVQKTPQIHDSTIGGDASVGANAQKEGRRTPTNSEHLRQQSDEEDIVAPGPSTLLNDSHNGRME